ncbi:hypothetical protein APT_01541 [Acetobacter pasteurianus NBRC 101655]|uniref:Uncharacterized protein n=4 Tax=Acetobacter pasteurianus TaxID=438 RepID=A0A1Y0Y8B0_ACEPA|nr:hypothetical protein S1001342_02354 [Acetobacter pasteurianus subsp. pasteurianus]OAZ72041.1 hypothetical protein SRCM100623_01968 [Acetobacter pasteurianus]CCT58586.1 hypothetical protein APA386B_470 [Acetobacter pasteurianus 386B]BAU38623.1 hypothetical protein APT_01541 [Acetobacter pasteurianus NBRC 101655]GCD49848.1 hypothetical protein NBRC106471_1404 [Acetobacter pasteurianus subsp. pasteurianus LMG 1262 = NBRC 106471]GCD52699.1 hypothetical protein NBRC3188_1396 [Acetobacter pasteur
MMGDLERIIFFIPVVYMGLYLIAYRCGRRWFP